MALSQFRAGLQGISKRAACAVHGGIRTAASKVRFSPPPDHTRTPPPSLSKRDRKTYSPKPPPSLKPRSGGVTRERSPSFTGRERPPSMSKPLTKKATREPTPLAARLHREFMKRSFPEGWSPPRKLSRQAMDGLRALHKHDPQTFSTPMLAEKFRISPEAVRRILRSNWEPSSNRMARLHQREMWERQTRIEAQKEAERKDYYKISKGGRTNERRTRKRQTFV